MTTFDIAVTWALPRRLQVSRQDAQIDQRDMARMLGVSRPTISNWERGVSEPNVTQFVRWAELTGKPLEWLADGVKAQTPAEAGAVSTVSTSVRPEGFEPPTF